MPTEQEQIDLLKRQIAMLSTAAQITALGQLLTDYKSETTTLINLLVARCDTLETDVSDLTKRVQDLGG